MTIESSQLIDIIKYWSFWTGAIPTSVPRKVPLPPQLNPRLALTIQGVRHCGKSTLLTQIITHYSLDPARCAFVNFEDPKLVHSLNSNFLDQVVEVFEATHPEGDLYFFLDEIQVVDQWERWIRTRLERPGRHYFIITGSNSALLSGEFSSVLTGRQTVVTLFPLSFSELRTVRSNCTLEQYLLQGGFPEPTLHEHGAELLMQYFNDIVERDIRERVGSRSSTPVRQTLQMAYESTGSELSLRRVSGATGIAVETVGSYLSAAEAAFLLLSCPFFAYSERKRAARQKKYYPIDTGLRRAVVTRLGEDMGKMFETMVFLELRRRYPQVCYWRGEGEVDFVIETSRGPAPVQVTWGLHQERHHKALESFYETFPHATEALMINQENVAEVLSGLDLG